MEIERVLDQEDYDIFEADSLSESEEVLLSVDWLRFKKVSVWEEIDIPFQLLDETGRTLLMHAASDGNLEKVIYCVENRLCDIHARCQANYNALAYAIRRGNEDIASYLQQHNLKLDNTGFFTPLNSNPNLKLEGFIAGYLHGDADKMFNHYLQTYITDINGHFSVSEVYMQTPLAVACSELSMR